MVGRPGPFLSGLFQLLFDPHHFDELADKIRDAASQGTLVYVLSHERLLDVLFLNAALLHHRLPLAAFVHVVSLWFLQPFRTLWALVRRRPRSEADMFEAALRSGHSALIFLRKKAAGPTVNSVGVGHELFERILEIREELPRPVIFVPLYIMWGHHSVRPGLRGSAVGKVFGSPEAPGRVRSTFQFLVYLRRRVAVLADPLFLDEFVTEHRGERMQVQSWRLRWTLGSRLERRRIVLLGPRRKGPRVIRSEILGSERVRDALARFAEEEGVSQAAVRARAESYLKEMETVIEPWGLRFLRELMSTVFRRMFTTVEVSDEVLEMIRAATQKGPVLYMPSHKSHVDYLMVSWIVGHNGISVPLIAAGINLSFWPLGPIFRHSGAFFLRRSFRSNRLYAFIFAEYLAKMLSEGYSMEFFIEGGRSRTGKVLPPKLGILRWIARAAVENRIPECFLLPIDLSYDRIVETRSYAKELAGAKKRKEDMGDVLRAGKVLGSTFGRVVMYAGKPYGLKEALAEAGAVPGCSEDVFNAAVVRIAHRVVYDISRLVRVSPTALASAALLASGRRAVPRGFVMAASRFYAQRIVSLGGQLAPGVLEAAVDEEDWARLIDSALDLLVREGSVSYRPGLEDIHYRIEDDNRPILAYYRNNFINLLVAEALVSRALLSLGGSDRPVSFKDLRRATLELSRLLKREFVYQVGATFDVIFSDTLAAMEGWAIEILPPEEGELRHVRMVEKGKRHVELLSSLVADFCEGYWSAYKGLEVLLDGPMGRKLLERRLHDRALRDFQMGLVTRREACIRTMFRSAMDLWLDQGVCVTAPGKSRHGVPLALAEDKADPELLSRMARAIEPFALGRPLESDREGAGRDSSETASA